MNSRAPDPEHTTEAIAVLQRDVSELKSDMAVVKKDVAVLTTDVAVVKKTMATKDDINRLELAVERGFRRQTAWLAGIIVVCAMSFVGVHVVLMRTYLER